MSTLIVRMCGRRKEGFTRYHSPNYPEDIQTLSHELIFRFVMVGFLNFTTDPLEDTQADPEQFVKAHADFLASKHPAGLLGAVILTEHASDLKTCVCRPYIYPSFTLL